MATRKRGEISWESIAKMEQSRWLRFACDHRNDDDLCRRVAEGDVVTQADAAQLTRVAAEKKWEIPSVGRAAAARRKKRRT